MQVSASPLALNLLRLQQKHLPKAGHNGLNKSAAFQPGPHTLRLCILALWSDRFNPCPRTGALRAFNSLGPSESLGPKHIETRRTRATSSW